MPPTLTDYQTRRLRMRAQRLLPVHAADNPSPVKLLTDIFCVQAQELPAALLSLRARSTGLTVDSIRQAQKQERLIAWTWCLRGTLHLLAAEDARWLVPLLGPALVSGDRGRMCQLGWDDAKAEKGLHLVQDALSVQGELTRAEIARLLKENNLPSEGQAPLHLIFRAACEGMLCPGPERSGKPTYKPFETWLGRPQSLPREEALARIARRYLQAYAPTRPEDLASWSGMKLTDAREAWRLIAGELVEVHIPGGPAWLLETQLAWLEEAETANPEPVVRLLPRYDTFLLGYASRDLVLDPRYAKQVNRGGGIINPVLLVDGRVMGTWKSERKKSVVQVHLAPFDPLPGDLTPLIEAEVMEIGRFLGEEARLVG